MALTFDPISSPDATRDVLVDLTGALEQDETLTLASVVSTFPAVLTVSNVATNETDVVFDEQTVAPGKGVHFTVATLQESQATVELLLSFEGDSGTTDKYEIAQPIVSALSQ